MIGAPTTGRAVVSAAIRDMQVPGWGSASPQAARWLRHRRPRPTNSPGAAAHCSFMAKSVRPRHSRGRERCDP